MIDPLYAPWSEPFIDPPELFPDLPQLASRLGVAPTTKYAGVVLHMKDGTRYSLFALMNAFLDRIDAATKE